MKFGKLLTQMETDSQGACLEGMEFVRYKMLKKQLKRIRPRAGECDDSHSKRAKSETAQTASAACTTASEEPTDEEEKAFVSALNDDVRRFNAFFMEREETNVIKLKDFEDRLGKAETAKELNALLVELVELHGHLVLLLHWSLLNYAALVKILKKHDKITGRVLKDAYLASALKQPFASTGVLSRLVRQAEKAVKDAERKLGSVGVAVLASPAADGEAGAAGEKGSIQSPRDAAIMRQTKAAIDIWRTMRDNASTPSTVASTGK